MKTYYPENQKLSSVIKYTDLIFLTFLLLFNIITQKLKGAADTLDTKSKIINVTVFFSGAQVTRSGNLKLSKGKHLIKLDKLPREINEQSIQVERIDGAKILSVKHELNYDDEGKKSALQKAGENKIEEQESKIKEIRNKISVFDLEEKILLDNSHIDNSGEGSKVKDIKEAADFYRTRLNEIRQEKLKLNSEVKIITESIRGSYTELNQVTAKSRKSYSQVVILLECEKEISTNIKLSYYIESAGWAPTYDFRVDDITKPLVIVYNANVYQSSGEDWKNVNIRLSNNNPTLKGSKPELPAWYIGNISPVRAINPVSGSGTLKGRVLDISSNEALPFASVSLYNGNDIIASAETDINGQYTIKPVPTGNYLMRTSMIGYSNSEINSVSIIKDKITTLDIHLHSTVTALSEVTYTQYDKPMIDPNTMSGNVTKYEYEHMASRSINSVVATTAGVYQPDQGGSLNMRGSRINSSDYYNEGIKMVPSTEITNNIANFIKTSVANLEYVIEIPYTIPADGQDYNITIKDVSVPVEYVYYAIPKLDMEAFLTAEIHDWSQLNLLSGKSSIYYQGTFTGESFIDVNNASDTLSISLGRDKGIIVKREGNKQLSDKRVMSNNIKQTIGWDITVKNNRNFKIKIMIEDQYPVSEKKSIEVELETSSNAKVEEKTGKLTWDLSLAPNEKKVLSTKYSIKYPKWVSVAVE